MNPTLKTLQVRGIAKQGERGYSESMEKPMDSPLMRLN